MDASITFLSESAASVFFGNEMSLRLNSLLSIAKKHIEESPFEGFQEVVLTYNSITVFYDPYIVFRFYKESPSIVVKSFLSKISWEELERKINMQQREIIKIPLVYGSEDIEKLSEILNLSAKEIIELHTSIIYQVFMIGFLPGFPYLGILPDALIVKRKEKPSPKIEKGSVAIAGSQTGIYPIDSPGGWHVLGKTKISMYDLSKKQRSFLKGGDNVRFIPI
jgi:inhibitor of KinA